MSENIIKLTGIKKYFGGVKALDGVDLTIKKGEVHCLAGENGCGKSTIINIISGFYTPDAGTIEIDGKEYTKLNTQQAIDAGVQVIYQDLSVFPNLTVRENLAITMEKTNGKKFVSKKTYDEIAKRALATIDFKVDLDEYVENLTVADKQMIAISRALLNNAKLIIMDEPTTAITQREVKNLFKVIRDLQSRGIAVLFVSHKLDEVFEIAQQFTIFRSGHNVYSGPTQDLTQELFTHYMTGRDDIEEEAYEYKTGANAKPILEVKNLSLANGFKNCSFDIKPGEIVGITGLLGSGRTELAETIFGIHKADSGEIYLDGQKVEIKGVKDAIAKGIGYVPPERNVEGLFMDQSIADNISVTRWDEHLKGLFMNQASIDESVAHWVKELSIKIGSPADNMRTLSGGNAQKCVLAKWLSLPLKVLILNGPTVGVDIGAKFDIYTLTKKLAADGLAVIIISDDIREVLMNCNRVLIMRQGHLVDERSTQGMTEAELSVLSVEY